ncbi:hypothetical protein P255_01186 [Acinetobacter brisouii CIP 110357]|uniref:Lipoprotein n=1 Tax=Acinetobacter brisouii CIP 110357 TaxID=1341683 RepID=V2UP41_9GAMM|nr:Sbal_3080 family lipoprotein [Acinetobacter brisouii]ENV48305.1 hypothetical protein F954_01373 [Acinetobacter brisouii ANC 4119]ESK51757.1 hypothetical protein P255_01186 [Acinetobacter brisouii CIP 110357]
MKKFIILTALILSGCATTQVSPLNLNANEKIKRICIEHNSRVVVNGFEDIVINRLEDNGISTETYIKGNKPSYCEYSIKYVAYQKWDFSMVLTQAELRLYKRDSKIADAEYKLHAGGLLNPTKYKSNESKINPLVDQLIGK